jgi:hypothetical protein
MKYCTCTEIDFEYMKGKGHLQHVGIDGREVLKLDLKKQGMGAWWRFNMAQDWSQWQAVMNVIMKL